MSQTHAILAGDHMSAWLGIVVDRVAPGAALISLEIRHEMVNGFGMAHGGIIFAFADTCFALTCNDPAGDPATITVASGADINFLAPAYQGQTLTAEGALVSRTGRSGIYDIHVRQGATLVAEFRGRSRTIRRPSVVDASAAAASP
ncbi:hotdog fold thioesterase [Arthrobacter echini]|uniref:Hotdog fold thioesterase n=2 Tax=Arthrobacter echini TaxID=1529066 RepID=A0A4V3Z5V0_9MICC|nr:hotdog fold thioesterase [Arthrobacter echini]